MSAPRNETAVRTTDVVIDKVATRLGNDGVSLADDFVQKLDQALGIPLEVLPTSPASASLSVGPATYTMPDGQRVAFMVDGVIPALSAGTINMNAGTVSAGSNPTFALPTMTTGKFVKALIQYKPDDNLLTVTFGTLAALQSGAGVPAVLDGYTPICLVEMQIASPSAFASISAANLIKIASGFGGAKAPAREVQDVTSVPKVTFTLTSITIPNNRARLIVLQNGVMLDPSDDYSVGSDTVVTMTNAVPVNGRVTFLVF